MIGPLPNLIKQRVTMYEVAWKGASTCFLLDHGSKRYVVTPFIDTREVSEFTIHDDGDLQSVDVELVGGDERNNFAIWAPTSPLMPHLPPVSYMVDDDVNHGQGVFAIGFLALKGTPFQVVTQGVVAVTPPGDPQFLVDARWTHGMMGGLVVSQHQQSGDWIFRGMIVGLSLPDEEDASNAAFARVLRLERIRLMIDANPDRVGNRKLMRTLQVPYTW